jgi:hypothetical protein
VTDQSAGEGLRKVRVVLQGADLQTVTDDEGRFRFEAVTPGNYTLYVSTIGYRLLKREISVGEGQNAEAIFLLGQEPATIQKTVNVTAPVFEEVEKASISQIARNRTEIKNLAGVLIDDPLRSVQSLPGVAGFPKAGI